GEGPAVLAAFVDKYEPGELRDPERVLAALCAVTVCDPACGSGAYLLGMLHELLDLRQCLFATKGLDAKTMYERKLEIIENSLYGVDIDPFAVNIARLRLWLSLAVDYEGAQPEPLPNLDFKVEVGDSLTGPRPDERELIRTPMVEELCDLVRRHFSAHGEEKRSLRGRIDAVRERLAEHERPDRQDLRLIRPAQPSQGPSLPPGPADEEDPGFDWQVKFAEVFADTGHRTPDTGHRTPDTGHRTPDTGHRTPDTGHRTPDTGQRTRNGASARPIPRSTAARRTSTSTSTAARTSSSHRAA
ncbi:MAG: hypothetical protein HYU66_15955, partial [Armatimonadetes bacterium]|nr:hypothetical protein [Armatimonadota bacterium]